MERRNRWMRPVSPSRTSRTRSKVAETGGTAESAAGRWNPNDSLRKAPRLLSLKMLSRPASAAEDVLAKTVDRHRFGGDEAAGPDGVDPQIFGAGRGQSAEASRRTQSFVR
ncbi:MAG: hypothetical protein MZV64_29825 [Ignavibacteriales bacterium]|nr:hypothetical protein [Ignavibacteriales bacterium]